MIPLLIREPRTRLITALLREDSDCWVWWATRTECLSGLHRRKRTGELSGAQFSVAAQRLARFEEAAVAVLPSEAIRSRADRLLGIHPLRAADAFQLAALLAASEERSADLPFLCLDERLAEAARKEGFRVLPD